MNIFIGGLEKLIVAQLVKEYLVFTELDGLLLYSADSTTATHLEPDESIPCSVLY
jgi:hypothetical protein